MEFQNEISRWDLKMTFEDDIWRWHFKMIFQDDISIWYFKMRFNLENTYVVRTFHFYRELLLTPAPSLVPSHELAWTLLGNVGGNVAKGKMENRMTWLVQIIKITLSLVNFWLPTVETYFCWSDQSVSHWEVRNSRAHQRRLDELKFLAEDFSSHPQHQRTSAHIRCGCSSCKMGSRYT